MNKKDLARTIAEKTNFSVADTLTTLNTFFDVVKETLAKKEKIQLVGFGTFEVRERIERVGKSPQDPNKEIIIPAKSVPYFKPGSEMKEGVNEKKKKAPKKGEKSASKKTEKNKKSVTQGVPLKEEKPIQPAPKKKGKK